MHNGMTRMSGSGSHETAEFAMDIDMEAPAASPDSDLRPTSFEKLISIVLF